MVLDTYKVYCRLGPLKTEKKERKAAGRRNFIRMDTDVVKPTQVKYQVMVDIQCVLIN